MREWRNWQTRTFEGRVVHTVRVQVPSFAPYRVFITDLSYEHSIFCICSFLRYVWSRFCACSFVLYGFGYIFDCNALSGISPVALSAFGYLNIPYKLVMNHNSLTAIFSDALSFINCYFIYQFTKQGRSQLLHSHI